LKQIFVKNCPAEWTHEDLHDKFAEFGEITSAKMSITANFVSRGYGFVEFSTVEAARKAVAAMDGKSFEQAGGAPPSGGKAASDEGKTQETVVISVSHYESKRKRLQGG